MDAGRHSVLEKEHAMLSASSSSRWLHCPPSLNACRDFKETPSVYAEEGTIAHELCAWKLAQAFGKEAQPLSQPDEAYTAEMHECADAYVAYIKKLAADKSYDILIEERVDYSKSIGVPDSFGTADCLMIDKNGGDACIVDFKYGKGQKVEVEKNTQLMLYAIGAYDTYGITCNIQKFTLVIFQPRMSNISTWEIASDKLLSICHKAFAPAAQLATQGKGEFRAGGWCRFCKVRAICRAHCEKLALTPDLRPAPMLTDGEILNLLQISDDVIAWLKGVKDFALETAKNGHKWQGFKLGYGKGRRVFTDTGKVAETVQAEGFDPYEHTEPKLKGITAMEAMLGRKKFNEILGGLTEVKKGELKLVPEK